MRAAVCSAYGGPNVVSVREVPTPTPRARDILVRIQATTVSSADQRVRAANFPAGFGLPARLAFGLRRPRQPILGNDLAGVVEAVGREVTRFRVGDAVIAATGARFACHATHVALPETGAIAIKPPALPPGEAVALVFGGTTAWHFLTRVADVRPGMRIMVVGASGAVGSAAVQIGRSRGAVVTGVTSGANRARVEAIGAHDTIDYQSVDIATRTERWDVILDTTGLETFPRIGHLLEPRGQMLIIAAGLMDLVKAPLQSRRNGRRVSGGTAPERTEDLVALLNLWQQGQLRPVVDSTYPLGEIAKAHARVDQGRKVGSVVVMID